MCYELGKRGNLVNQFNQCQNYLVKSWLIFGDNWGQNGIDFVHF